MFGLGLVAEQTYPRTDHSNAIIYFSIYVLWFLGVFGKSRFVCVVAEISVWRLVCYFLFGVSVLSCCVWSGLLAKDGGKWFRGFGFSIDGPILLKESSTLSDWSKQHWLPTDVACYIGDDVVVEFVPSISLWFRSLLDAM